MPKSVSIRLDLKGGPDYRFSVPTKRAEVVLGDDATYQVDVDYLGAYSETVTPSLSSIPEGVPFDYDPSSLTEEGSTTLTIDTDNISAGTYLLDIESGAAGSQDWLLVDNADRLYDWGNYTGIPDGIPENTTVYTTLTSTATTAQVNAAIAACPANQVVALAAGTYSLGALTFGTKTGVTLRGAGAGQTIINMSGRITTTDLNYTEANGITVSSGYTKGSTSITLASTPSANFAAGAIIALAEDASANKWSTGIGTYYRTGMSAGSSLYLLDQTRVFRHMNRVVSVDGNTITLAAPLPLSFSASLNVKAYPPNSSTRASLCGVESMTLDAQDSVDTPVWFHGADRCWLKDVELKDVPGSDIGMIRFWQCFQCEINRCYVHGATGWPNQTDGFASSFNYGTSNCLIIDTIVSEVADLCETNGAAGCAYLYNYGRDMNRNAVYARGITLNHGPHGLMNLAEGNIVFNTCSDGYHGSTSHIVLLRNHFNGLTPAAQKKIINICRGSYYYTVVGNVLGDTSWNPTYFEQPYGASATSAIYAIGFPAADTLSVPIPAEINLYGYSKYAAPPHEAILDVGGRYIDPDVSNTLIRHGNYDYYNDSVIWDGGISSQSIPNSLFYDSKPTFFGSLSWPSIGPDVSGYLDDNPAKARWDAYAISSTLSDLFEDQS